LPEITGQQSRLDHFGKPFFPEVTTWGVLSSAPLCVRNEQTMEIKRPNQERFNMSFDENYAFWEIVLKEYSLKEIRGKSLLVYSNRLVRNEDAG
jgi:hypothetical protein